jgi:molecular chaperone HtpG
VARTITDSDLPGLYVVDPQALRALDRKRTRGISGGLWGGVLDRIDALAQARVPLADGDGSPDPTARLCLNWSHPLVRKLAGTSDDAAFARTVQLLYVQSLLAGHHPLQAGDRALLADALGALLDISSPGSTSTPAASEPPAEEPA